MSLMTKLKLTAFTLGVVLVGAVTVGLLWPRPAAAEGQTATPLSTTNGDTQETSFGDLTADALREVSGANVALVAAISFRPGSLASGPLTEARVGSLLANPEETWAVSRLKGSQIKAALENAVHSAPLPNTAFLQVSGLTFEFSVGATRGQRVRNVRVGFSEILDDGSYTVAMPLSLAKGGSGYFKIFTRESVERQSELSLVQTVVQYGGQKGSVSYSGFGRITAQ